MRLSRLRLAQHTKPLTSHAKSFVPERPTIERTGSQNAATASSAAVQRLFASEPYRSCLPTSHASARPIFYSRFGTLHPRLCIFEADTTHARVMHRSPTFGSIGLHNCAGCSASSRHSQGARLQHAHTAPGWNGHRQVRHRPAITLICKTASTLKADSWVACQPQGTPMHFQLCVCSKRCSVESHLHFCVCTSSTVS